MGFCTVTDPGNYPCAFVFGALNAKGTPFRSDDVMATYSSKGPTRFDQLVKPDIAAPGNRIRGLLAPGSRLAKDHPELVVGTGNSARLELSGTSMAAATVSGAAALVLSSQPKLKPLGLRLLLQLGAQDVRPGLLIAGAGSLNVAASVSKGAPTIIAGENITPSPLAFTTITIAGQIQPG